MKRLFLTTALVALSMGPAFADTHGSAGQMGSEFTIGEDMAIQASTLIGQRLYIQRGMMQDGMMQDDAAAIEAPMGDDTVSLTESGQSTTNDVMADSEMADIDMGMGDMAQGITAAPDNWEMAGEIRDVILTQDGQVSAVVVDAGGFLGMNETERRVDMAQIRFIPDTDDEGEYFAVYSGDRTMFEQSEAFDEAALTEMGEARGSASWGDEGMTAEYETASFADMTTEELLGTAVYGSNDNWVGEISELALAEDGMIEAVIIDVGGFLGIGEKPVAMSLDQVELRRMSGDDLRAYVAATEEELDGMEEWMSEG